MFMKPAAVYTALFSRCIGGDREEGEGQGKAGQVASFFFVRCLVAELRTHLLHAFLYLC